MGVQYIFVVETNSKCKTDWIYIRDTIERFYQWNQPQIKLSVVYMNGKGNYKNKEKDIRSLSKQYQSAGKGNQSKVILCFDCDEYEKDMYDQQFLNDVRQYCRSMNYEFVWFCKDIESVYLGRSVEDKQKKKESAIFKAQNGIKHVDVNKLLVKNYRMNSSNLMCVLDKCFARK